MAYKINDTCVACGTCASTCPVGAIKEGTPYVIQEDVCVECGACAAVCPVDCCIPDDNHVETEAQLLAKQRFMHPEG